jgi:CheY-like chemotaxis protein
MKKILIIEDEPDVARTMQLLLQHGGLEADIALGGEEGLKKMKEYNLILLDIMMPEMSGRQVLDEMKKRGLKKKVIIVSAVGLPDTMRSEYAARYPGTGFVSKSHMNEYLVSEAKKALEGG